MKPGDYARVVHNDKTFHYVPEGTVVRVTAVRKTVLHVEIPAYVTSTVGSTFEHPWGQRIPHADLEPHADMDDVLDDTESQGWDD